jgi:putative addiction module antidote
MAHALKLVPIGNSTGVVLPKEVLAKLRVEKGNVLYLSESADGGYRVAPYDPEFARQMQIAEEIMRKDRDALRILTQ